MVFLPYIFKKYKKKLKYFLSYFRKIFKTNKPLKLSKKNNYVFFSYFQHNRKLQPGNRR